MLKNRKKIVPDNPTRFYLQWLTALLSTLRLSLK